ncbi:hypothetical protein CPB84DRAFT_1752170 [Gymnopilus junonius]|uniref:Uncharacterized protein n=1 Tax=Gymnopilus junonius TaxID=109634 RepID=A0A9P5NDM1_GYMJU|nr:hypothetical protein CPB84DRAFT_1752170 [Gymnopilus junonius]
MAGEGNSALKTRNQSSLILPLCNEIGHGTPSPCLRRHLTCWLHCPIIFPADATISRPDLHRLVIVQATAPVEIEGDREDRNGCLMLTELPIHSTAFTLVEIEDDRKSGEVHIASSNLASCQPRDLEEPPGGVFASTSPQRRQHLAVKVVWHRARRSAWSQSKSLPPPPKKSCIGTNHNEDDRMFALPQPTPRFLLIQLHARRPAYQSRAVYDGTQPSTLRRLLVSSLPLRTPTTFA